MNSQQITKDINVIVQEAMKTAIGNNDVATLSELVTFSEEILYKCIKNGAADLFSEYIDFPVLLHLIIANRVKEKEIVSPDIHKYSFKIPARILRENLGLHLGELGKDTLMQISANEIRTFYYHTYRNFNLLLFKSIAEKDINDFQLVLTQLDKGFERVNYHKHLEKKKQDRSELNPPEQEYRADIYSGADQNSLIKEVFDMRRLIITGARYWLNFLYYKNKIDQKLFEAFTRSLRIPISSGDDFIKDLLFVTNFKNEQYLDWIKWEYDADTDGEKHKSVETTSGWMEVGFLVDIIRSGSFFMNTEKLKESDVLDTLKIYTSLKQISEDIIKQGARWINLLEMSGGDGLRDRIEMVLSPFKLLAKSVYKTREDEIADMGLSEEKIKEFKELVTSIWRRQARIRYLFEIMKSQSLIPADGKNLIRVGQRNFLEKGKMAFVDDRETYSRIYGLEDMGGLIGRWEDDLFFNAVSEVEFQTVTGKTSPISLDAAISELKNRQVSADVIITSPEFSYKDNDLLNNQKFIPKANLILNAQMIGFSLIGSYDEIPVYTSFSDFVQNRFIVCDFQRSFKMEYKSREDWQQGLFNVAVRDLTEDEINERTMKLSEGYGKSGKLDRLVDTEFEDIIKTSIVIDAWTITDFVIKDTSSFIVAETD